MTESFLSKGLNKELSVKYLHDSMKSHRVELDGQAVNLAGANIIRESKPRLQFKNVQERYNRNLRHLSPPDNSMSLRKILVEEFDP